MKNSEQTNPGSFWYKQRKWQELSILGLLALLTLLLFFDGELDMRAAELFYHPESEKSLWPEQHFWLWKSLYVIGHPSAVISGVLALGLFVSSYFFQKCRTLRKKALYVFLVIVLGPGLLVNGILKEHWGRPRPREVTTFQGEYDFQKPWVISNTGRNAFVCGHCSVAYMFFALYFVIPGTQTLVFTCTILYSFLMALARMSAGGHFVSDILWSGYVVFFLCWFLNYYVFKGFSVKDIN